MKTCKSHESQKDVIFIIVLLIKNDFRKEIKLYKEIYLSTLIL